MDAFEEFIFSVSPTLEMLNVTFRSLFREPMKRSRDRVAFQQLVVLELFGRISYGANLYDSMVAPSLVALSFYVKTAKRRDYEGVASMLQASMPPLKSINVQSDNYFEINYDDSIPLWPTLTHLTIYASYTPKSVLYDLTSTDEEGASFNFCPNLEVLELAGPGKAIALDKVVDFIVARRPLDRTRTQEGCEADNSKPEKAVTTCVSGHLRRVHISTSTVQIPNDEFMEIPEIEERIQDGLRVCVCSTHCCDKCVRLRFLF
jgi:hypothetical protein